MGGRDAALGKNAGLMTMQTSTPIRLRPARIVHVEFDPGACRLITAALGGGDGLHLAYPHGPGLLLDVRPQTSVETTLRVRAAGTALCVDSRAIPYAIAAVLLGLRDATGVRPVCRFRWPRHHRLAVVFGITGRAAQVRDVLRHSEPDPHRRPVIQVGE